MRYMFTDHRGKTYLWSRSVLDDTLFESEAWDKPAIRRRVDTLRPEQVITVQGERLRGVEDAADRNRRRSRSGAPRRNNVSSMETAHFYRQRLDGGELYFLALDQLKNRGWRGLLVRHHARAQKAVRTTVPTTSFRLWERVASVPKEVEKRFNDAGNLGTMRNRATARPSSSARNGSTKLAGPGGTWRTFQHAKSRSWAYRLPTGGAQTGFDTEAKAAAAMRKHANALTSIRSSQKTLASRNGRRGAPAARHNVGRKILAHSKDRYTASAEERRRYGGNTVTEFYVMFAEDERDASKWKTIMGYGKSAADRKRYAIEKFEGMHESTSRNRSGSSARSRTSPRRSASVRNASFWGN